VVQTPEVLRVFVGSMWGQPYAAHADAESNHKLFDLEREAILGDLRNLPKQSRVRRINETVKRWRAVRWLLPLRLPLLRLHMHPHMPRAPTPLHTPRRHT
jgi:hypothetical protein